MTSSCARCNQTHPMDRMLTIINSYHNGPHLIDVCQGCTRLGDRVVGPDDVNEDDLEWGEDSAQQELERGPR